MSQFIFLQPEFAPVFDHARKAEIAALSDPRAACFYARLALETAIKWMYAHDGALRASGRETLATLINDSSFHGLVGNTLATKARFIKDYGNRAVHEAQAVAPQASMAALRELFHFSYWLVRTYAKGAKPAATLQFSDAALPKTAQVEITTLTRLQALAKDYDDKAKAQAEAEAALLQTEQQRDALESEIKRLQAEIAATKKANQATPDTHDYNEAQTRDAFIDLLLQEAGWPLDQPRDREFPVTGMPNPSGAGFVDYVLWGDDGKPLALIEAKRTRRDPRVGQQQAQLYADALQAQFGQRPIIFTTNGYQHWLWDDANYPPRPVQGFLKKDELMLLRQRRASRQTLAAVDIDGAIVERPYQTRAIRRVGDTFEKEHRRKALLVMATGAGKTRTVIALIDQLMRANWVKRALFLADRVALVNQAVNAFKSHLPHVAPVNLVTEKNADGRVFVSTYPTMMGLIDDMQNGVRRFGTGHFDLIVIDEAHRSVYRKYKTIFDYFDSLLVGLTATPRDEIDRDTYALFDLGRGDPTDVYDLKDAVADGYLTPLKAVSVPLKFQRQGIRYDELSDEEKAHWDELEWDESGNAPDRVDATEINKWLFNADTVDKVLQHLMTHGLKVNEGERLGKTILFARNHEHAVFIAERFDAHYPHWKGSFARVIDFKTEYAQSLIDNFSNPAKDPQIAISVDMLDTGIDVPEVVNLVFLKSSRSKTKFWQMIGRGTRLCPNLFGPGRHKEHFLVFDFCQNFEFFSQDVKPTEGALGVSLSEKLFAARVNLIGEIDKLQIEGDDESLNDLRQTLIARLRDEVAAMSLDNFIVRPQRRAVEKFQSETAWTQLNDEDRNELRQRIARLPSAFRDDDLAAMQFDYLVLSAQLALLRTDPVFAALQARIISLISQLESLGNVPMVAAQMVLILEAQTAEFWQEMTLPILENLRRRLRELIKLIESKARKIVYSDFEDEIGAGVEVSLPDISTGVNKPRFLQRVRYFLIQYKDHITIQKLKRNEQLTSQDLAELERIFLSESVGDANDLERIRKDGGLGIFIRTLVGLDRKAAKRALGDFMAGRNLSTNQIEFMNLIIDYLTECGVMDPRRLYESPFTDMDDQGINGVFPSADVKAILSLINDVRARAVA
ncbi:MAG: DEAD/DEAH box helicase family protein [Candidatus Competibacteraceae bacterium]|nr:DEAD/DEAH box helicase family protein [Candidatus Competibacteraceae bacterium]